MKGGINEDIIVPTYEESLNFQSQLLGLWEKQQNVLGYTEASIALCSSNIIQFLTLVGKFIWEVSIQDIDEFQAQLVGRGLAYSTRRKYQSNITTFLDYLRTRHSHSIWEKYKVVVPNVIDKFNRHYHRQDDSDESVIPPSPEILNRFWEGMREQMKTARKYSTLSRDYTIFKVLALAGLRINESVMLDVKDCRFDLGEKGKIHVRFGKGSRGSGHKARWVPLLDGLDELLRWYLKNIRPSFTSMKDGPLFLSENGSRLNRDTARGSIVRRQKSLGFTESEMFSPHQLRHAFASNLVNKGVDLLTLKELLGHVEISTTFVYTTPSSDYLENRIRISQEKWRDFLQGSEKTNDIRMET